MQENNQRFFLDNKTEINSKTSSYKNKSDKTIIKKIIIASVVLFLLICVVLPLIATYGANIRQRNLREEDHNEEHAKIIAIYGIISGEINILSDEFDVDENILSIYVGNKKINFTKKYYFNKEDSKQIIFEILTKEISMKNMFKNLDKLQTVNFVSNNNGKIISMESTFENSINLESVNFDKGWDTSNLISMKKTFAYCEKLNEILFDNIILSNVKDMSQMFQGSGLAYFTPNKFDLISVESMESMFKDCQLLILLIIYTILYIN